MTRSLSHIAVLLAIAATLVSCTSNPPAVKATPAVSVTRQGTPTFVAGVTTSADAVWIAVSPRVLQPGATIVLSGQGFAPGEAIAATLVDQSGQVVASLLGATADIVGALAVSKVNVPKETSAGHYALSARGLDSGRVATLDLWVRVAPPTIELNRDNIHPEEALSVKATGFAPLERVVIYLAGRGAEPLAALSSDDQGNLSTDDVVIPIIAPGDQRLVATGSVSLAQATHDLRVLPFEPVAFLNANNLPPGEMAGFYGHGFAARDQIVVSLEGGIADRAVISADARGIVQSPDAFPLPPNLKGRQTFQLSAPRTGQTIRLSFIAIEPYPYVSLGSYSGRAGDQVPLTVRNLRPRERLDVSIGEGSKRKKLGSFRADDAGSLPVDASFRLPQDAAPGTIVLALDGEASRTPLRATYVIRP